MLAYIIVGDTMDKITCLIIGAVVGGAIVHCQQKKKECQEKCQQIKQEQAYKKECVLIPLSNNCKKR